MQFFFIYATKLFNWLDPTDKVGALVPSASSAIVPEGDTINSGTGSYLNNMPFTFGYRTAGLSQRPFDSMDQLFAT